MGVGAQAATPHRFFATTQHTLCAATPHTLGAATSNLLWLPDAGPWELGSHNAVPRELGLPDAGPWELGLLDAALCVGELWLPDAGLRSVDVREGADMCSPWQRRTVRVGCGLVAAGAVLAVADIETRALRTDYLPTFRYHFDDYMQFAPGALLAALWLAGLESSSTTLPTLAANVGASMATYLSVVYAVKYGTARLRPDGSTHNSFPSGHTANAFCMATMLHKEYGHLSPWVSIAGYTLATATGIGRTLNNRHWLSDVVVGAGVGILSTEVGYWLAEKILGKHYHIKPNDDICAPLHIGYNPSYVGISVGGNLMTYDKQRFRALSPSTIALDIEGAWFFTPSLGIGGKARVGRYANIVDNSVVASAVEEPKSVNSLALLVGPFYTHHLPQAPRWQLGGRVMMGLSRAQSQWFDYTLGSGESCRLEVDARQHFAATAGVWARYVVGNNLGVRLFADYNYMRSGYSVVASAGGAGTLSEEALYLHPLTIGIAVDALLW